VEVRVTAGSQVVEDAQLQSARWRLLTASSAEDPAAFQDTLAEVAPGLAGTGLPCWDAWAAAFAARGRLLDGDPEGAAEDVTAAEAALERCRPTAERALTLAYLAHVQLDADRYDAALHLSVDASVLAEQVPAGQPSRELQQAHAWLSLALTALDLEELAAAQALRCAVVAEALPYLADRWQALRLCAQQHAELAQTVQRRGDSTRGAELAAIALTNAQTARALPVEPSDADLDLLDVVQAWALTLSGELDDALPPLRRVRRHLQGGATGMWLRGYTDLVLARLLTRRCARDASPASPQGEEAVELLVAASGEFARAGDRRRYRQCLLELGQATAAMNRTVEALHWLEGYRHETTRAHLRSRELWAELFVRRSRLREAERQTAVLRRHALEDVLTGLGNRRSAERRLTELGDAPDLSLAVLDVDGFKTVNDERSHLHGDAVLRRVAELLRQHSRTGDEVYRWAGDEFVVLLPATGEAQAVVALERVREAVAGADWAALDVPAPITISIGLATSASAGRPRTWRELFDSADLQLFNAKRGGRNQVRAEHVGPHSRTAPPAGRSNRPSVDDLVAEVLGGSARRPGWAFDENEVTR
jgi:diguanylate cyclase (GGDEF)-like protein